MSDSTFLPSYPIAQYFNKSKWKLKSFCEWPGKLQKKFLAQVEACQQRSIKPRIISKRYSVHLVSPTFALKRPTHVPPPDTSKVANRVHNLIPFTCLTFESNSDLDQHNKFVSKLNRYVRYRRYDNAQKKWCPHTSHVVTAKRFHAFLEHIHKHPAPDSTVRRGGEDVSSSSASGRCADLDEMIRSSTSSQRAFLCAWRDLCVSMDQSCKKPVTAPSAPTAVTDVVRAHGDPSCVHADMFSPTPPAADRFVYIPTMYSNTPALRSATCSSATVPGPLRKFSRRHAAPQVHSYVSYITIQEESHSSRCVPSSEHRTPLQ